MSPSSFLPLAPRWCGWCQKPVQGRSDKQFCSAACRSKANRHGPVDEAPVDWPAQAAAAEQRAVDFQAQLAAQDHAWQLAFPFEQRYDELTRLVSLLAREVERASALPLYLDFVDELLHYYQQHPGLVTGEVHVQRRLAYLQQVQAELRAHYATLQQRAQQQRQWEEQRRLREELDAAARNVSDADSPPENPA